MSPLQYLLLAVYFSVLIVLSIYGLHRYFLAYLYYRYKKNIITAVPKFEALTTVPYVTVQLPIYNEQYVVDRLVQSVCALDYPKEKLEIQLLDDSTDVTVNIASNIVDRLQQQGFPIVYLHRTNRNGYKAGALAEGLLQAKGELIAVFDADFVPEADFLKRLVPYFSADANVGMVQARWGHINRDFSLLTQTQSIFLDGHFVIEHAARNRSGKFFNFNGTAGVWRKSCIQSAGGWQHDTLTEDLDLSYRAQLKGWQFVFVPEVVAPAELPVEANAFKSQQHRWAKGSIQTARKLLPKIIASPLSWSVKSEALFHLTNNIAYLLMIILSILMPLAMAIRYEQGWTQTLLIDLPLFLSATFSVSFFYCCSQRELYQNWKQRLKYIPINLAMGIGLSVNNAKAVLEALFNNESEFVRTPKYAVVQKSDSWKHKIYKKTISWVTFFEVTLAIYFFIAIVYALNHELYVSLPFLLLFLVGYSYIAFLSLFQGRGETALVKVESMY